MDRFTRNYLVFLGLIGALILGLWIASIDPRVGELNDLLAEDPVLAGYPYRFRVLALENGVAELSTPRSFSVPAVKFLTTIQPELRGKSPNDPAYLAAQQALAEHQKRAKRLILE